MWRSKPEPTKAERAERWARWLADEDRYHSIAQCVKQQIRDDMKAMSARVHQAEERMQTYDRVRDSLVSLGLDPERVSSWGVEQQIERAHVRARVSYLAAEAENLASKLRELSQPKAEKATA